ncbi:MAG: reverse transcriptase family protein [Bacteroides sp.]|nr:reverse transcriptase family protein [Bacteroides sp.]
MRKKAVDEILANWRKECSKYGMSVDEANSYIEYVANLIKQDLPPIVDLRHLSMLIGIDYKFLTMAINAPQVLYREFSVPKRSGGYRTITAPYPSLKYIQTWIYDKILKSRKTHFCAHGFVRHRSILSNAGVHRGCKMLLKMDVSDFFGSISQNYVVNLFKKEFGYNLKVSWVLSSLCCLNGTLPQGAPTSPILSNLISMSFDRRLYRLAKRYNLKYSRYADDIAFSGDSIPSTFIRYVEGIANNCGFKIKTEKTRLYSAGGSKIIAGVSLATGEPRLPRDYRRKLRQELHYVEKYGLKGHMKHEKIRKANYLESLLGKVNYWLSIEPGNEYALSSLQRIKSLSI